MIVFFVRNRFNLFDKGTWMAPFIRSALNHDNRRNGEPKLRYNHVVICVNEIVFEAGVNKKTGKPEVIQRPLYEWMEGRSADSYYAFALNGYDYKKVFKDLVGELGKPYDFKAVLWHQLWFQITGKRLWIGHSKPNGKWYCSNIIAWVLDKNGILAFENPYKIDPEILWNRLQKNTK